LLRPFLDWGFREGHDPTGTPERRMSAFREWFVRAYSQTATVAATDDS